MLAIIMTLAVVFQYVDGYQRIVQVSKLISDDEDVNSHICCVYGNCTCNSFDHALANLTSNVLINITTDVTLSSLVKVSDLQNVSIIGHNNPTVKCKTGGINFVFFHNCIIQSITWDRCGTEINNNFTEPGIKLNYSSNVTIKCCCFQHSIGQALVLSEVSGNVNINNCNFVNNSNFRGHGAAIHHSYMYNAKMLSNNQLFTVSNCNFTSNKNNRSLVYIKNRSLKYHKIIFNNSMFRSNQGTSVYVINHKIYINGKVSFQNNVAEDGAGIYISDHSTVMFGKNSNVTFYQNFADIKGGAVSLSNYSICVFDHNSIVTFNYNKATKGGAINSEDNSNVTFQETCKVIFSNNLATQQGAAIYSLDNSHIIFIRTSANSSEVLNNRTLQNMVSCINYPISNFHDTCFEENFNVVFCNNTAIYGGAIFCENNCHISFENASTTVFINNAAYVGGAIHCYDKSHVSFKGNSTIIFSNNTAIVLGGAIYSFLNINISFEGNSVTKFTDNTAAYGGAMRTSQNSYISFKGNSTTVFSYNTAIIFGGAIESFLNIKICFEGNSVTEFSNNIGSLGGGAIHSYENSYISFGENSVTEFSDNTVTYSGGAINSNGNSYILFEGNSVTEFSNNTGLLGGAIDSHDNSFILFEGISVTGFSDNSALDGGALTCRQYSYIYFKGNSTAEFSNNIAHNGAGAMQSCDYSYISFKGNSTVVFSNNTSHNAGGAIHCYYNSHVSFEANSFTRFIDNTVVYDGAAIYSKDNSNVFFQGSSVTVFSNNNANGRGGAINSHGNSCISFEGNSVTMFSGNTAHYGQAIYSQLRSYVSFEGDSVTVFSNGSSAKCDRTLYPDYKSYIMCTGNSTEVSSNYEGPMLFNNSTATIFCFHNSKIIVKEHSSVIFNEVSAKWCMNICLPYPGETDAVVIDSNGIVWCSNVKAFRCLSDKCYCKDLSKKFEDVKNNHVINITDEVVVLSSVIHINSHNVSIIGHNNPTVICFNDSGLHINRSNNLTIESITWIGCGATNVLYDIYISVLNITYSNNLTIQKCSFLYSGGQVINLIGVPGYLNITNCTFMGSNHYRDYGVAIDILIIPINLIPGLNSTFTGILNVFTLKNCDFRSNRGAKSVIHIIQLGHKLHQIITYLINSSFSNNQGVNIYLSNHHILHVMEEVLFQNNEAEDGAGIYITNHSTVIFGENSNTKFINNSAYHNGAAIFLYNHSSAIFDNNSIVKFYHNKARNGIVYSKNSSTVMFKANCKVTFNRNSATQYGAAIYSFDNSQVAFTGNSTATFSNNIISFHDAYLQHGGTILSENNGILIFEENSVIVFNNNSADFGAAIFSIHNSNVLFKESSRIIFNSNIVHYCGVLTSAIFSNIAFTDNTKVTYESNTVSCDSYISSSNDKYSASTICTFQRSKSVFSKHSLVTFINNRADRGAAIIVFDSNVIMEEHSTVILHNNSALYSSGGAFVCSNNSNITIKGNSDVSFNNNRASQSGGAIHSYNMCRITFKDNSTSTFISNTARDNGGAILSSHLSEISFEGSSKIIFDGNTAENGGVFHFTNSTILFKESSLLLFYNNKARQSGGVGYFNSNSLIKFEGAITVRFQNNLATQIAGVFYSVRSNITFKGNSTIAVNDNKAIFHGGSLYFDKNSKVSFLEFSNITFHYNRAFYGGAIIANDHSNITVTGNSVLLFANNEATQSGGAVYLNYSCNFIIKKKAMVGFDYNKAFEGGAICISYKTKLTIKGNSTVFFCNNLGTVGGGAVKVLNDSMVTFKDRIIIKFTTNNAQYGAAIFLDATSVMDNSSFKTSLNFTNNIAKILGNSVYQDAAKFCNSSCLSDRLKGISSEYVATPPNELKFYDPATCIDNDYDTQCNSYYVQNIMLGTEIVIPACVLDYYNQSLDSTQFLIYSEAHSNYFISGPKQTLISCDTFEGIRIIGNQSLSQSVNFSINITLNIALNSNWKQVSVNLIIELSPCHPGFWQYPKLRSCECYNASDIVFCFGSSSTIKRGYWFGSVAGKPTVTFCPINYCNFTCCETSNGYYHLSPVRDNQCRSHRSGTACGSCEEGYTLSFDSVECVHMNECSIGYTILVLVLVVLYWIIIIAAVFSLMHFKVGIGYLYAITYYYSVVDLLLSQNWYHSNALYTTLSVISSVVKIIPQFLGQICFITNMSGIDQQFIHYIHPVAISLFLVMITVLARRSYKMSSVISKGIIHVICCLLLLSYTSLATTSLLLMRPLTFHDVDKVYTYVSPDIGYFHGRHLVYGIVAVLSTIVIVIGLPLLLALEPFLSAKINFIRIKPLLDQFQGCYKDKYRCFAAYYMICRLIIITLVIANSSSEYIFQSFIISACVMMDLTHQIFKPYSNTMLNNFDGIILHFLVLVSVLPLAEIHNDYDPNLAAGIVFIYVMLPLLIFITMSLIINKDKVKSLPGYFYLKCSQLYLRHHNCNEIPLNEIPLIIPDKSSNEDEYINVIDDSKRKNATICDV